jgi:phosphoribosyl 1,2-cyclic phosphodiesterase
VHFQLRILGSSSEGNCAILQTGSAALMIDCGFGVEQVEQGLRGLGLDWQDLSGLLLTHTHGDHAREATLRRLARAGVPLVATSPVIQVLRDRGTLGEGSPVRALPTCSPVPLASFALTAIPVPHDSPGGCVAYRVSQGRGRACRTLAYATDIGYATRGLEEGFVDSDIIVLESNHDPLMLERSDRPRSLKIRIRSMGHLSNQQSADLLSGILYRSKRQPESVVLAHLSRECNTPEIAREAATAALRRYAARQISLLASPPSSPGLTLSL